MELLYSCSPAQRALEFDQTFQMNDNAIFDPADYYTINGAGLQRRDKTEGQKGGRICVIERQKA